MWLFPPQSPWQWIKQIVLRNFPIKSCIRQKCDKRTLQNLDCSIIAFHLAILNKSAYFSFFFYSQVRTRRSYTNVEKMSFSILHKKNTEFKDCLQQTLGSAAIFIWMRNCSICIFIAYLWKWSPITLELAVTEHLFLPTKTRNAGKVRGSESEIGEGQQTIC